MAQIDKVNVLLVDDQPAKLLAYEVILQDLDENLDQGVIRPRGAEYLLKNDVAILLIDVCMPELDGFQLAAMIREHPRFQQTAIIFISAIHLTDVDLLRGYAMGAVDYVPVPVVPEVLRAKVKVFAELYRKTRQLEQLNRELERRVAERTADLEASNARLLESERRRSPRARGGTDGIVGLGYRQRRMRRGTMASTASSASIPTTLRADVRQHPALYSSGGPREDRGARQRRRPVRSRRSRPRRGSSAPPARCAGASARRR